MSYEGDDIDGARGHTHACPTTARKERVATPMGEDGGDIACACNVAIIGGCGDACFTRKVGKSRSAQDARFAARAFNAHDSSPAKLIAHRFRVHA